MAALYSTIFSSQVGEVKMRIAPRTPRSFNRDTQSWSNTVDNNENVDFVQKHTSKKGTFSLIYNPVVSMIIDVKGEGSPQSISIPLGNIYRFTSTLSHVYQSLNTKGLYNRANGFVMDKGIATQLAIKFAVYSGYIVIAPAVTKVPYTDEFCEGVSITSPDGVTAVYAHSDVLSFHEALKHLDLNSYSMLSTMLVKMVELEDKLDKLPIIESKVDQILMMLGNNNNHQNSQTLNDCPFDLN